MALAPVAYIAPPDVVTEKKAKKGGGGFGSAAGAVVGGAIGAIAAGGLTGGAAAVQGGMAGAAAGSALGGQIGNMIDPAKAASQAIDRRVAAAGPQMVQSETSAKLRDSILALQRAPDPVRAEYSQPLVQAYMASLAKDHSGVA